MVKIDQSLIYKRESQESAFTLLIWNTSKEDLISELKHKLNLIANIKNNFKKTKLNDRLYGVISSSRKIIYSNI